MTLSRGDVVLAWFPFSSGAGSKRRPAIIVQNDEDNLRLGNIVIVQITSNLARANDKSHFLIEVATDDGKNTGLLHDSLVSYNNIATIEKSLVAMRIGNLSHGQLANVDRCLAAALGL